MVASTCDAALAAIGSGRAAERDLPIRRFVAFGRDGAVKQSSGARAILVGLVVAGAVGTTPPAIAHHRPGPCDFHRQADETIQRFSKPRIVCAVDTFGPVRGGTARALCIARRESGLDPTATSEPTGRYRGLYQHDRDFWAWRYDEYTRPRWELPTRALNGRTNAIVAIRMVFDFGAWRRAGWPRKDC